VIRLTEKPKRAPIEGYICFIILAVMCCVMGIEVVARYAFNSSLRWAGELSRYLFIWFIFIGASYAIVQNTHIRIEAFFSFLPKRIQPYMEMLGNILWCGFSILIAYIGFMYSFDMLAQGTNMSAAMKIPMGIIYLAIPVGYTLMAIRLLQEGFNQFKSRQKNLSKG
jgi:C4-dicarboxylate transporter, DctQ subunit